MIALFLALAATAQPGPAADEWRPYAANPKYEVLGHDEAGVFRFRASRKAQDKAQDGAHDPAPSKAAAVPALAATNFGLNLTPLLSPAAPVSGTDMAAGRELMERTSAAGRRDCPDGRCDRETPKPAPAVPHPLRDVASLPVIGWVIVGVVLLGFAAIVGVLLLLVLVSWLRGS